MFLAGIFFEKGSYKLYGNNILHHFRGKLINTAGFLFLTGIALLLIMNANKRYKDYYAFDEGVMLYNAANYKEAGNVFYELAESFQNNGIFWQYYAKACNMNGDYAESIELYERAKRFTSDEYLYTSLGDSYRAVKDFRKAEEAYKHASFMVPHKFYPLYLLAKMYDEAGDKEKAFITAREILNKTVKVESIAVGEILDEMRGILEENRNP